MKKLGIALFASVLVLTSGCNLFGTTSTGSGDVATGSIISGDIASGTVLGTGTMTEDDKLVEELMNEITADLETQIDTMTGSEEETTITTGETLPE